MPVYVTTTDSGVSLNGTIPFNSVSIPCNSGLVTPLATGILNLKGRTSNRFARYKVTLKANVQIPAGGAVTAVALGIKVDGATIPESVAIITPAAVGQYQHINTDAIITVPCGCCVSVSGSYVDGTEDDATVTPTPSITVRREASIEVERLA